ncbi:hypothetical protein ACU8KH_01175 [Lachancea thermotolerans]
MVLDICYVVMNVVESSRVAQTRMSLRDDLVKKSEVSPHSDVSLL